MDNIKCPKCGTEIPLNEALTGQIEASLQIQYNTEMEVIRKEADDKIKGIEQKEKDLAKTVEAEVNARVTSERSAFEDMVKTEQASSLSAIQEELKAKTTSLDSMREAELDLRRQVRETEEKAASATLDANRKLDDERATIKEDAARVADEANRTKLREKDNLLEQMTEQLEALKRKSETGSQEAQGEAQEDILIETLSRSFPYDLFDEVAKGVKGGDIIQTVRNTTGKDCGRILWESKNTKAFSKQWIEKVKADQMRANANLSVIMTVTLPSDLTDKGLRFGIYENVWITDFKSSMPLAVALRQGIIEADKQRVVSGNQESLQALLYEYLTGKDAQMKIMAVVDSGNKMTEDLNKERNAMERIWGARQKQIEKLTKNFNGFFGNMEGILGQKELPSADGGGIGLLESISE